MPFIAPAPHAADWSATAGRMGKSLPKHLRSSIGPINSTIYESRVTFMLDDPDGVNKVAGFAEFGCMMTCHDDSRAMPTWVHDDGEVHKYLLDTITGRLDLWHHRLGRANHIGLSDDQWVGQRIKDEGDGKGGSRHGDDGTGPYATASTDDGNP